jgi:hypothetical protein
VLICLLRLHGGAHPMVRALHARVAEYGGTELKDWVENG